MLRINQSRSAGQAKSYYSTSDYYTEGQELAGLWRGKGAELLGLAGKVEQPAWEALCDNRHPASGEALTVRRKRDRTIGYDFNFHVPKSVSLLYALSQDDRILEAFRESVGETMREMETEAKTRVRTGNRNEERVTGNMAWGEFIHFTSRPVDGVPDPHLHAHCFVHNATFDEREGRWKAAQFRDLKRDAPYFEQRFHVRMAGRMQELGLEVERNRKGWELKGLSREVLDRFSRRTSVIEEEAKARGITGVEEKSALGAKTRERKQKNLSMEALRAEWRSRLGAEGEAAVRTLTMRTGGRRISHADRGARDAAALATDHCFERKSVVPERELLAEAFRRSIGQAEIDEVERAVGACGLITGERDGRRFATTAEVLGEEERMLSFARDGRGTCAMLGRGRHEFHRQQLNEGQRKAVAHVLESTDRVILIRGAAGTGKTMMMSEAVEAIEAGGSKVFAFAPSAAASRGVLAREGFKDAETVARLLRDEKLQEKARGSVLWVDEAGLLGVQATAQLFDLAGKLDARVVLCGDRRQHGSVERGAALRLLETEAGLAPAEVKDIMRQRGSYRQAVRALSEGRTEDGFERLDEMGWVKEAGEGERHRALARDYAATVTEGKTALVVSPTHVEGERITAEIRAELKHRNLLGGEERSVKALRNKHLTLGERSDPVSYSPGDVLVFHQNAKGHRKGTRLHVGGDEVPVEHAGRYQVFEQLSLKVATGETLRITQNGRTKDGEHRLNNGALVTVKSFSDEGDLVLSNGWMIDRNFGHLAHGVCVTSHASQGSTVDRVFIGQGADSFAASSQEQFYVSVSRGRERAVVYTDDKQALLEAVRQSDERVSATEFLGDCMTQDRARLRQSQSLDQSRMAAERGRVQEREEPIYER